MEESKIENIERELLARTEKMNKLIEENLEFKELINKNYLQGIADNDAIWRDIISSEINQLNNMKLGSDKFNDMRNYAVLVLYDLLRR